MAVIARNVAQGGTFFHIVHPSAMAVMRMRLMSPGPVAVVEFSFGCLLHVVVKFSFGCVVHVWRFASCWCRLQIQPFFADCKFWAMVFFFQTRSVFNDCVPTCLKWIYAPGLTLSRICSFLFDASL